MTLIGPRLSRSPPRGARRRGDPTRPEHRPHHAALGARVARSRARAAARPASSSRCAARPTIRVGPALRTCSISPKSSRWTSPFQVDDVYRRNRRLVAFDMDSTLIQTEVIDELAAAAGVGRSGRGDHRGGDERRARLQARACVRRLRAPEGARPRPCWTRSPTGCPITDGAERLIRTLEALGYKTAILSGGFTLLR